MVNHIETVEEKVRNKLTPMSNIGQYLYHLKEFDNIDIVLKNEHIQKSILDNCEYLIKLSQIVDKYLPEGFDINKEMEK